MAVLRFTGNLSGIGRPLPQGGEQRLSFVLTDSDMREKIIQPFLSCAPSSFARAALHRQVARSVPQLRSSVW